MRRGLIVFTFFFVGLSLFGIVESSRLERTMEMGVGITFFPLSMSLMIGGLAILLLAGILKGKVKVKEGSICQEGGGRRVLAVGALLAGYLILIEAIGYVPSTFLFFFATVFILGKGRIAKTMLTSAAFTLFLYAVFQLWLKSPLPTGFLGI